jgi:hypothetical protein
MSVDGLPIAVESAEVGGQDPGGQTLEAHPGQHEEASISHEQR